MNVHVAAAAVLAVALLSPTATPRSFLEAAATLPRATLAAALPIALPGMVDSNSPLVWDWEDGPERLFVLTSHSGQPSVSSGVPVDRFSGATEVTVTHFPVSIALMVCRDTLNCCARSACD